MSVFNGHTAYNHAIAIVTAAINAGQIKFTQPDMSNQRDAEGDAKYINDLINAIAENLKG